jgi:hypothetical protein
VGKIVALGSGVSRVLLPFKAVFWVVLISFVITGGDYERAARADGKFASVQHTAAIVVEGVAKLRTLCDDHEKFCDQTKEAFAGAGDWTAHFGEHTENAWDWGRKKLDRWFGEH